MLSKKAAHPRGRTTRKSTGLLMGKLFDESGEPLYSCWAKKGQRRYRYLVSKRLVRGTSKPDDRGWRLPAERMERAVIAGIRRILSDRGALASTLKACGFAAAELKQAIEAFDAKVKSLEQVETTENTGTLIERVELRRDGMQITLNLRGLLPARPIPRRRSQSSDDPSCPSADEASWRRNATGAPRRSVQPPAQIPLCFERWRAATSGSANLRQERFHQPRRSHPREGVSDSYVRHMVPLALLAPAIVESICAGRQGVCLSAERLKTLAGVPIEWDAQQRLLAD